MNNTEEIKKDISKFIIELTEKYGYFPKFAHNLQEFNNRILYSGFYWNKDEIQAALESFLFGNWSINGNKVMEFERKFSEKINQNFSLMTNSGSSANLIMIAGLKKHFEWKDDIDEIAVSCCTFPTTVSVIPQNRLKPLFIDINFNDLNIDLDSLEKKITKNTKAIMFAPTLGNPGNFERLLNICEKYKIHLILDNCDSVGTTYLNKELSEYAVASSCSFFASHHLSCIQAGMISSNIENVIETCRAMIMWGRNCFCRGQANLLMNGTCKKRFSNWLKDTQPDIIIDDKYFFKEMSYNLQPLEFQGAIGLEQIKKWDRIHDNRRKNKLIIENLFKTYIPSVTFPKVYNNINPSWFGVGIITKDYEQKRKLVQFLEENKIQCRNFFSGNILEHPGYKHLGDWSLFPKSSESLRRVFFVGCAPFYTYEHLNYIEKVLSEYKQ